MTVASARSRWVVAAALALCSAAGGCSTEMQVLHRPPFYSPELRTIAVVEFGNESGYPKAGRIFTDQLVAALRANGTYEVLAGVELEKLLGRNLPPGTQTLPADAARLAKVQAVLTGTVVEYLPRSGLEGWRDFGFYGHYGYFGHRSYFGFGVPFYYRTYATPWSEADVAVMAELIGVPDGERIYATGVPLGASSYVRGYPPTAGRYEVLAEATASAVKKLLAEIAVVAEQIKVKPGKVLRLARKDEAGRWDFTGGFRPDEKAMYAVVALPPAADGNRFRLIITRKDSPEGLAEREFVWAEKDDQQTFEFSPREISKAGGQGDYRLHFYSAGKLAFTRNFNIKY